MTLTTEMSDTAGATLDRCVGSDYGQPVAATPRKTPQRTLVVDPDEWNDLATAAKAAGSERAQVLRQFIKWYIRRPGARLPQRPGD
jgi:hypothetical protein